MKEKLEVIKAKINVDAIKEKATSNWSIGIITAILLLIFLASNFVHFHKSEVSEDTNIWTSPSTKVGKTIPLQETTSITTVKPGTSNNLQQQINSLNAKILSLNNRIEILEKKATAPLQSDQNTTVKLSQLLGTRYDATQKVWVADIVTSEGVKQVTRGDEFNGKKIQAVTAQGIVTNDKNVNE